MNSRSPRRVEIDLLFRQALRPCREAVPSLDWEALERALPRGSRRYRAFVPLLRLRVILEWLFIQPAVVPSGTHIDMLNHRFLALRMIA